MSSAEQPGKDSSKRQGDSAAGAAAVVEKALGQLESVTATLVEEVGTSSARSAVAPAVPGAAAASNAAAPAGPAEVLPVAGATQEPPPAPLPAGEDRPDAASVSGGSAHNVGPAAGLPTDKPAEPVLESPPPATDQVAPAAVSAERPADAAGAPADASAASAQAEIDQEINQAIEQLKTGQPAHTGAQPAVAAPADPAVVKPPLRKRVGLSSLRVLDALLAPVVLLLIVADWPFRWLPNRARQLLGYIALGTTLTAAVLWTYLLLRTH